MHPFFDETCLPDEPSRMYTRSVPTEAWRIHGPFAVKTPHGVVYCEDGYLALDVDGHPYPIACEVFYQSFELKDAEC